MVRLVPAPSSVSAAFVAVASIADVIALLGQARRLSILSAFEVMWPDYYDLMAASDTGRRPVEPGQAAYVQIETMGYNEDLDNQIFEAFLADAYETGLIVDAVVAGSNQQIADLWRVREGAEVLVREIGPFVSFDISVDVASVSSFLDEALAALKTAYPAVKTATFGHLGDNNIHIAVHIGPETMTHESEIERIVFRVLRGFGGAITAEHGIGQLKREFLPDHKHVGEMMVMRAIRQALDGHTLLNRDVLF